MREVAVIGVGQSTFGKFPERSIVELGSEAVLAALKDANVSPKDIQFAYGTRIYDASTTAQSILAEIAQ